MDANCIHSDHRQHHAEKMHRDLVVSMLNVVMRYVHALPEELILAKVEEAADYVSERVRAVKQRQA